MNKMVVFYFKHKNYPDVEIKGVVDGDYLLSEDIRKSGEGIVQYYQGETLRWDFPVNSFMKGSIRYNAYEELKRIIADDEEAFAEKVFKGDKNLTSTNYHNMVIIREVLTW